ncbi:MAG: hypothetical protein GX351_08650 [Peptococcaceae bacterium]|jgi:FKBP-type peptidyl-prolyl cis-trans isomerase (trigger factor)|nr:hypothetical protein [Peptococcaceae bacterium]
MSVQLLNTTEEEAAFLIEIDAKTFEKALIEEYNKETKTQEKKPNAAFLSNVAILKQYSGLQRITDKAIGKLMPSYYQNAIDQLGLHPMSFPKFVPRMIEPGQPCVIEVQVIIEPRIELKKYEGLQAAYTPVVVTDLDIAKQIKGLRKQHDNDDAKLLEKYPFDTIEALQEEMRNSLNSMAEEKTADNIKDAVINKLIEENPLEVREEIIEQQVMVEINQLSKQMGPKFLDSYLKSSGKTLTELKKEVRPQAEKTVKKNLLLAAVADKINPEITEEELKEEVMKHPASLMDFSSDYETRRKRLEQNPGALEQIKHAIRLNKALDYLVSKAVLQENEPRSVMDTLPDFMKPEE